MKFLNVAVVAVLVVAASLQSPSDVLKRGRVEVRRATAASSVEDPEVWTGNEVDKRGDTKPFEDEM